MAEIFVTSTADSGAGSLRQAIADAQDGDVILFDADVFPVGQTTSILLSSSISLNKSVSIYGGESDGAGGYTSGVTKEYYVYRDVEGVKTKVYIDDETPAQEGETLLFENVCRVAIDGQNATRALYTTTQNKDILVAGISVNNCCSENANGGAVYLTYNNILTLVDCRFNNCESPNQFGGAIYSTADAQLSTTNCSFVNCTAKYAGAITCYLQSVNLIDNCAFDSCSCTDYGGAFYCYSTSINTIRNCRFYGCSSNSNGGVIFASVESHNEFNNCSFIACNANNGGACFVASNARTTFTNVLVKDCAARIYGGGFYFNAAVACSLNACVFDSCEANNSGGGVYANNTGQITLTDCVFDSCSANYGGALESVSSSINTLNNCSISNCTATTGGGGVYSASASQNTLNDCTITDCSANYGGGGVYSASTSQNTLNDCTITNCSANYGGGVYSGGASHNTLTGCTFDDCAASTIGGGIISANTSQNTLNGCTFDASSSFYVGYTSVLTITGGITIAANLIIQVSGDVYPTITIADGAALTITTSATIGAATFTSAGRGYLAVAAGIDTSAATLTNVVLCSYGAGLESFSARETTRTEIKLDWTQMDTTIPVLVEQKVGDSWETVVESTAGTYNVTIEPATRHLFRAFDGVSFHVDAAWHGIEAPQFKVVGIIVEADAQDVNWQAITEVVNVDGAVRSGQSITILARIYDAYDNETILLNETGNIVSVVYTLEKRSKSLFDYTWTPVEGHDEVEVSSECVLEDLQTSDAWTVDEDGYSFVLTPDTTEHTLFATPGVYRFRVKITLAEGNPVVFYEEINVVDE